MPAPDRPVQPEEDERSRAGIAQRVERDHDPRGQDGRKEEGVGGSIVQQRLMKSAIGLTSFSERILRYSCCVGVGSTL